MRQCIFLALVVFVCTLAWADNQTQSIEAFWRFVKANEMMIFSAGSADRAVWNGLSERIQGVDPQLSAMVDSNVFEGKKNLVITSSGQSQLFPLCDLIVEKAPVLTKLRPLSLFPPGSDFSRPFIFGPYTLRFDEVRVHFEYVRGRPSDLIYLLPAHHLRAINADDSGYLYNVYMNVLYQMTMQVIGERNLVERVSDVQIALVVLVLPTIPLVDLQAVMKTME